MSDVLKISTPTGDDEADAIAEAKALAEKKARIEQLEKSNADLEKLIAQKGSGGAPAREGMRKNADYKAVSTAPSINKTPRGRSTPRLPYPTVQDLSNSEAIVPTVTLNGDPAYVLNQTVQPSCKGDDPGTALGVKSGTVNGYVKPTGASSTVTMGGQPSVRIGDPCVMNGGNNPGIYVTAEPASANPAKSAVSTSNPSSGQGQDDVPPGMRSSEKLDALQKQKAALQAQRLNYDALDEYVNFGEANNGLDAGIASIQGTKGTWTDSAAQGTRGVLGFVKDAVTGIGELAYEGIKGVPKLVDGATTEAGQQISQINGQILAENIRLGNITPGTIGQGAQNIGSALVKPVTAPWSKGNYVEALARGATEVGTLFSGTIAKVGKLGGAAKLGEAADAVKAAEAAKIADAADAAKAATSPGDGVVIKPFRGKIRFRSAKDVNEELLDLHRAKTDSLPFKEGTTVTEREMMPGERFKMSMDDDQLALLKDPTETEGIGGWGTRETFGSQSEALDRMAIRPEWKPNGIPNTVEFEVVKPFRVFDGVAGPQPPLGGDAQQYFLDLPQTTAKEYVRVVNVTTLP